MAEKPEIVFYKIQERHKTIRLSVITTSITLCFCAIVAGVTMILLKWMDDPPWLRLLGILIGPQAVPAVIIGLRIFSLRRRLRQLEKRLESTE